MFGLHDGGLHGGRGAGLKEEPPTGLGGAQHPLMHGGGGTVRNWMQPSLADHTAALARYGLCSVFGSPGKDCRVSGWPGKDYVVCLSSQVRTL